KRLPGGKRVGKAAPGGKRVREAAPRGVPGLGGGSRGSPRAGRRLPGGNGSGKRLPGGNGSGKRLPGGNGSGKRLPGGNGSGKRLPGGTGARGRLPGVTRAGRRLPGGNGSGKRLPGGNGSGRRLPGGYRGSGAAPGGHPGREAAPGGKRVREAAPGGYRGSGAAPGGKRGREAAPGEAAPGGHPGSEAAPGARSAALRARMEQRLLGARFRYLNQQLYTCSSREAARLFRSDPGAFELYHRGFERQVGRWPENPVQRIIRYLRRRPASLVVADFGCGDCKIAASVRNQVHCFDLVPLSPLVTVCDMAEVPLAGGSVDVAVFCLALMGTNLQEILEEANRVLRQGGTLLVAEVASRFEDTRSFLSAVAQLGFRSVSKDLSSPFFYLLEFCKVGPPRGRPVPGLRLKPCLYKRR
ncbi:ribosomal RNA-processing protein 8, partial [Porphyrio hochstetteri]